MNVSLNWLSSYIDLEGLGTQEMADMLTFAGIEVEGIQERGVTTDLEEALFGNDSKEEIFDLQGRRVERITAPGLYIVNGQKRYVKAAKF